MAGDRSAGRPSLKARRSFRLQNATNVEQRDNLSPTSTASHSSILAVNPAQRRAKWMRSVHLLWPFCHHRSNALPLSTLNDAIHFSSSCHNTVATSQQRGFRHNAKPQQKTATASFLQDGAVKAQKIQGSLEREGINWSSQGKHRAGVHDRWKRPRPSGTRRATPQQLRTRSGRIGTHHGRIASGIVNRSQSHELQTSNEAELLSLPSSSIEPPKPFVSNTDVQSSFLIELGGGANPFVGASGFWPDETDEADVQEMEEEAEVIRLLEATDEIPVERALWIPEALVPRIGSGKVDLSSADPAAIWPLEQGTEFPATGNFRAASRRPFRKLIVDYMELIDPWFGNSEQGLSTEDGILKFEEALEQVFDADATQSLHRGGYDAADVVAWAWVLNSTTAGQAVARYIQWAEECSKTSRPTMPRAIPLQILRARPGEISMSTLEGFLKSIETNMTETTSHFSDEDDIARDEEAYQEINDTSSPTTIQQEWDIASAFILFNRLLRHARVVSPALYSKITSLACKVFLPHFRKDHLRPRLTHMANRLLYLISLAPNRLPFRMVLDQQLAQKTLVEHMLAANPEIPLTREGYRALIRVQLVHPKTDEERAWADAKRSAWPPWRHDQTGMDERRELPGKESRASRLLQRMLEAGYEHLEWEQRAAILAGWDTDRTPTIQTRAYISNYGTSLDKFFTPVRTVAPPEHDEKLWSTRIMATRTVREAWACFLSFKKSVATSTAKVNKFDVYSAMFDKILANVTTPRLAGDLLQSPGDGLETFPDPVSPSEHVYVEREPPTKQELYQMMMSDGVRPAGHLLARLIEKASSVREGFQYLHDSALDEVKKDVLRHCPKYDADFVKLKVSETMPRVFAALIELLCRSRKEALVDLQLSDKFLQYVPKLSGIGVSFTNPQNYAIGLLRMSESKDITAWNKALNGMATHSAEDFASLRRGDPDYQKAMTRALFAFNRITALLSFMRSAGVQPDMETFRNVARCRNQSSHFKLPRTVVLAELRTLSSTKDLFAQSIYADENAKWTTLSSSARLQNLPEPEHMRILIECLGLASDVTGLHQLVAWMHMHAKELQSWFQTRHSGLRMQRLALVVLRIFLEEPWSIVPAAEDSSSANSERLDEVAKMLSELGWPSSEEVQNFLNARPSYINNIRWVKQITRKVKLC